MTRPPSPTHQPPPPDPLRSATETHRALASRTRSQLLAILRSSRSSRSARELADALGLHPNTVREQLEPLIALGLVERRLARPTGPGRPGFRYASRRGPGSRAGRGDQPYQALAAALADRLAQASDPEAEAVAAGERWGRSLVASMPPATDAVGAITVLVTLLDQAGFAPELGATRPGGALATTASLGPLGRLGPLGLHRCPFAAIVGDRREVVCGAHLGLMRGALEGIGAPLQATRLEPFVRPDLCLAHLAGPADG